MSTVVLVAAAGVAAVATIVVLSRRTQPKAPAAISPVTRAPALRVLADPIELAEAARRAAAAEFEVLTRAERHAQRFLRLASERTEWE